MDEKLSFNMLEIKADLIVGISECNKRGLVHSGKVNFHSFVYNQTK